MQKEARVAQLPQVTETFEERTTDALLAVSRVLERLEDRFDSPVFDGGFEKLVGRVAKFELVQEQYGKNQEDSLKKINDIHASIYDPKEGLYFTVKHNAQWISKINGAARWSLMVLVTASVGGFGGLLYAYLKALISS